MSSKGLPFDFCSNPDRGLPLPDITLFLTLSPEIASSRAAFGAERYETIEMQDRVRAQFGVVADTVRRTHGDRRWVSVSAEGSKDEVGDSIWREIEVLLGARPLELEVLWQ